MADPMTAMTIGSTVVGNIAGARGKAAQEAQQNAAAMQNYLIQQNKEAMASDRQNEKIMDQYFNVVRKNEMIEYQSMKDLFGNASELQRVDAQLRKDMTAKAEAVREANEKRAMTAATDGSAMQERIALLNRAQLIKADADQKKDSQFKQQQLLDRREGQLAQRQSEAITANTWQPGSAPTLYNNSSTFMAGAVIGSIGAIAGGFAGNNKYGGD